MIENVRHAYTHSFFIANAVLLFDCTFGSSFYLMHLELNDRGAWTSQNYIEKFEPYWQFDDNVERIDENAVSCDEFIERFEKIYKPVVIVGSQVNCRLSLSTI